MKLYDAIQEAQKSAPSVKWPFLMLHGDADELCHIGGSQKFFDAVKSQDKTFKVRIKI